LPGSYHRSHESSLSLNESAELRIQSTFGTANGLSVLSPGWIGAELMELDVGTIDKTDTTHGVPGQKSQNFLPQT